MADRTCLSATAPTKRIQIGVLGDVTEEPDETFLLTLSDSTGGVLGKSTATVTLLNDDGGVPQAQTDEYVFNPDRSTSIPATIGVLANDSSPDRGPLTVSLVKAAEHGALALASNGSFSYSPATDFGGLDQFVYQVCDGGSGRCARGVASLRVGLTPAASDTVLLTVPPASDPDHQGFLRFSNLLNLSRSVTLYGVTQNGKLAPRPVTMVLDPHQSRQVNSQDLENGNQDKELAGYFGPGDGNWTVIVNTSDVPIVDPGYDVFPPGGAPPAVLISGYVRTPEGFLTSLHSQAGGDAPDWTVPTFNPANNTAQVSWLRIVNLNPSSTSVIIQGTDDGATISAVVATAIPAFSTAELTASDLENGNSSKGLIGAMGHGSGKWRLKVSADQDIAVQSLLSDPNGYLTDLSSTLPESEFSLHHHLYYLPRASNTRQQGFIRITNPEDYALDLSIAGHDDTGRPSSGSVNFRLRPGESRQFNSADLQYGNGAKAIGSLGEASGDWRLDIASTNAWTPVLVNSFIRTPTGFLTSMHDVVATHGWGSFTAVVPIFNPAVNTNQVSTLRLTNITDEPIVVRIQGTDDAGQVGIGTPEINIPAQATVELTASDLEQGNAGKGLAGHLGTGSGKWLLSLSSDAEFRAVNLLRDPNGYVTNLSSSPNDDWPLFYYEP